MMSLRSALATFAALALAVALVACGPVGPSSGNATKAPLPTPGSSQAGSNVGEVHGTLNAEYEQTLKGPDSTQEGS